MKKIRKPKGYCFRQVNFHRSSKIFQVKMSILQLRDHTHHPSSPHLPNQRLNWSYLRPYNTKYIYHIAIELQKYTSRHLRYMETMSSPHNFHNATSRYEKQAWKNVNRVKLVDTITKTYLYKEQLLLMHHHVYATPLYACKYRSESKKSLNSPIIQKNNN